jgi:hypothetical protein
MGFLLFLLLLLLLLLLSLGLPLVLLSLLLSLLFLLLLLLPVRASVLVEDGETAGEGGEVASVCVWRALSRQLSPLYADSWSVGCGARRKHGERREREGRKEGRDRRDQEIDEVGVLRTKERWR